MQIYLIELMHFWFFALSLQHKIKTNFPTLKIFFSNYFVMVIYDYYYNVLKTRAERNAFRDAILARTGMCYNTFYYKLKNHSWKRLEFELINNLIKDQTNA